MADLEERLRAEWEKQSIWLPGTPKFEPYVERDDGHHVMRWSTKLSNGYEFATTSIIAKVHKNHSDEGGPKKITGRVIDEMLDRMFKRRFQDNG
jgi:hypothetical protein